jgi:hypothetical protein
MSNKYEHEPSARAIREAPRKIRREAIEGRESALESMRTLSALESGFLLGSNLG